MDTEMLRDRIERLDPGIHRALRQALAAEYKRRTGEDCLRTLCGGVSPDPFEGMFRCVAGEIAERYVRGTAEYIEKHQPDLYQRTEEADERMNEVWQAGRQGRASVAEFRAALEEWQRLHLEQIDIYRRETEGSDPGVTVSSKG